eukprot:Mrub_03161.p1 GENE.Mrub_03161~~Mrub_03161.p1  ORF type:complete len:463 (+),score=141.88 Mrub_03161:81-1391(+)
MGQGTYGCVVKAYLKDNKKEERACKIIPKSKVKDLNRLKQELGILKKLDHPNIVKLYEYYEDQKCVYLVMEMLRGGELFDRIVAQSYLDEKLARQVFNQITRSLNYCHKCNIVHRDLKPENFMTVDKDSWDIKLIDFGLAKNYKATADLLTTKAGTPYYIAPEVLTGKYDHMCDIWSLGVILYIMLCGYPPFRGETDQEILLRVKKGKFEFDGEEWEYISKDAKDLVSQMLVLDPSKRITAEDILSHNWFASEILEKQNQKTPSSKKFLNNYSKYCKFKKIVYTYLAMVSSEVELKELKKAFEKMDTNGDGVLSYTEVVEGLKKQGYSKMEEIEYIFQSMDIDHNQKIEYTEFLAAMMDHSRFEMDDDKILLAFKHLDYDDSGFIDRQEILKLMGKDNEEIVDYIVRMVDTDKDGKISFEEFKHLMVQEGFESQEL